MNKETKNKITLDMMRKFNSNSHREKRTYEQPIVETYDEENTMMNEEEQIKKEKKEMTVSRMVVIHLVIILFVILVAIIGDIL